MLNIVIITCHFGTDKSTFKVSVNNTCTLWCCHTLSERPSTHFLYTAVKYVDKPNKSYVVLISTSSPGSSMPKSSKNISLSSSSNVAISSSIFALITITSESSFAHILELLLLYRYLHHQSRLLQHWQYITFS